MCSYNNINNLFIFIFLSFYLSIFLSFYLSIFLYFYLSIFLSFYLSIFLSFYLSIFLSFYLSFFLSNYLYISYLYVYLFIICFYIKAYTADERNAGINVAKTMLDIQFKPAATKVTELVKENRKKTETAEKKLKKHTWCRMLLT